MTDFIKDILEAAIEQQTRKGANQQYMTTRDQLLKDLEALLNSYGLEIVETHIASNNTGEKIQMGQIIIIKK